jgi:hypothetical protein
VLFSGCDDDRLQPMSIEERPDGTFDLLVECADGVTARVVETAAEIRIDRIFGEKLHGDCLGSMSLELTEPPETRRVTVQGQRWVQVDGDCELDVYADENVEEEWGWVLPLPCSSAG